MTVSRYNCLRIGSDGTSQDSIIVRIIKDSRGNLFWLHVYGQCSVT